MKAIELLKLVWSKIDRPHSMCPDVEIGYIRQVLSEVIAADDDLLKLVWSKIDRPHSTCPDVEIGYVRQVLGEVMAALIKDREIIAEEPYRWVLGQLLVSPMSQSSLENDWYKTNRVYRERTQPLNDNYDDGEYQKGIGYQYEVEEREEEQRALEVSEALKYLLTRGLVVKISEGVHEKYFGDLAAYQKIVDSSMLDEQGSGNRPETGPMCFEGDWPGVFIRGDNAFGYVTVLTDFLELHPPAEGESILESNCRHELEHLIELLHSSNVSPRDPSLPHLKLPIQRMKNFVACKA